MCKSISEHDTEKIKTEKTVNLQEREQYTAALLYILHNKREQKSCG